jgi:hypothetical protein
MELSYTKSLNGCYKIFTNIFKFWEYYINNLNIQKTSINFKNKNPITNKSSVKRSLTNNLEVDKQINKVKKLNLKSKKY